MKEQACLLRHLLCCTEASSSVTLSISSWWDDFFVMRQGVSIRWDTWARPLKETSALPLCHTCSFTKSAPGSVSFFATKCISRLPILCAPECSHTDTIVRDSALRCYQSLTSYFFTLGDADSDSHLLWDCAQQGRYWLVSFSGLHLARPIVTDLLLWIVISEAGIACLTFRNAFGEADRKLPHSLHCAMPIVTASSDLPHNLDCAVRYR